MYNKLFSKILDSSIWLAPNATRLVWVTLIASMDDDGFCQFASVANVAHRARVELDAAEAAIRELESPDPYSGDPEFEGRRIERVPGGWLVRNAGKYREIVRRADAREANRRRVRRHRERQAPAPDPSPACNGPVTPEPLHVMQSDTDTDSRSDDPVIDVSQKSATGSPAPGAPGTTTAADGLRVDPGSEVAPGAAAAPAAGHLGRSTSRAPGLIRSALEYERALRFCAYVGARLEVPSKLHADLVRQTGGADADSALRAWYAELDAEIEASGEPIAPDVWKWVTGRWRTWAAGRADAAAMAAFLAGGTAATS